jgi:hypothetical protein
MSARLGSCLAVALLLSGPVLAFDGDGGDDPEKVPAQGPIPEPEAPATHGIARWFNPATAPFIPVPEIAVDPDSGTTLGLIPTWVTTNDEHAVSRIVAPDILHNPYFGWGVHGRIYEYSSADTQYSVVAGLKERVERKVDAEYQTGRLRDGRWSFNASLLFDRDGTPRFYGIGNNTRSSQQTNYTAEHELAMVQVGFNINHTWQIQYTAKFQVIDVLPGTLNSVPSIETKFPDVVGLHANKEFLNRLAVVYDTRDDLVVPTRGMKWVAYGGASSRDGVFNASLYSETGVDGRIFWPVAKDTVVAVHTSVRYLLSAHDVPFWALSSIGGGQSETGGPQQLRGYGTGRFYDQNSFSGTVEMRRKVFTFNAVTTALDIEVAPFIDVGRVSHDKDASPIDHIHQVYGVGFRGIARPFVVGYVDVGIGSEGATVFTGLNYPF